MATDTRRLAGRILQTIGIKHEQCVLLRIANVYADMLANVTPGTSQQKHQLQTAKAIRAVPTQVYNTTVDAIVPGDVPETFICPGVQPPPPPPPPPPPAPPTCGEVKQCCGVILNA